MAASFILFRLFFISFAFLAPKCNYTFPLVYFFHHIVTRMLLRKQVRINIILLNMSNQRAKRHLQVFVMTHL